MLIGAVAIAFIFLGLAAVYTAQLSARPATTGAVGDQGAEATEFNREARRNVRAIAVRVNHDRPYYSSRAALRDQIRAETNDYSGLLAETYASGRGASVNVSAGGGTATGTRITLYNDSTMTDGGNADWTVVDDSDVGWFVLNFNVTAMNPGDSFVIEVEDGTGADTTYTFSRNTTGRSVLTVDVVTETGALGVGTTCNPRGNRSLFDLTTGESFTSGCAVEPGLDALEGPYTVEFRDGDDAIGKFSIVTNDSAVDWGTANNLGPCPAPSAEPCNTYAAWDVGVTARYESGPLSYNNTQTVTVYEGA